MPLNIFLLNPKNSKDKDGKNMSMNFCYFSNLLLVHFSKNNSCWKFIKSR